MKMKKIIRPLLWTVFGIYCLILIYILFISRISTVHYSIPEYFARFSNFVPFKTIVEYIQRYGDGYRRLSVMNLLGNLVLFLPMGALLPCLFLRLNKLWKNVLLITAMVITVEITQALLRVGSIDIDDLIFNLGGAMIGYAIIKIPFIYRMLNKIEAFDYISHKEIDK